MRTIFSIIMLLVIGWSGALVWFVASMPTTAVNAEIKTEALVVLTGGQGRVEHGLAMLAEGAAPLLFISGVGAHVTTEQILAEHGSPAVRRAIAANHCEIVLDHIANSTVSNADQTHAFLRARSIRSIRLITATYHMKRSIHEFNAVDPRLTIIPDPVFPEDFKRARWWQHENTRRLVFNEFYKYSAVVLRDWLKPETKTTAS